MLIELRFDVFISTYISTSISIARLVTTLKKSQLEGKLIEFFPSTNRTAEKMTQHFEEAGGLEDLVKWQVGVMLCFAMLL